MSKFDFFEEGIRRVLNNYELPLEENSWANFQAGFAAGKATSFLRVFALPGILVACLFGVMHISTQNTELALHEDFEHSASLNTKNIHQATDFSSTDKIISEEHNSDEIDQNNIDINNSVNSSSGSIVDNSNSNELDEFNSTSIENPELIKRANSTSDNSDSSTSQSTGSKNDLIDSDSEDGLDKGPMKTKYEGSNYKLGAPTKFTPNNDNKNDTFMPPLLTEKSSFLMRIYDRGGNIIFESNNVHKPWGGTVLNTNKPAELGEYRWNVILDIDNKREEYEGKVRLVR